MRRLIVATTGLALVASSVVLASASTPSDSTVTVPAPGAPAATAMWTGTSPIAIDSGGCDQGSGAPNPTSDSHGLTVIVPAGLYAGASSLLKVDVTNTVGTDLDLLLTDSKGNTVAAGTSGDPASESLQTADIAAGAYTLDVCTGTPGLTLATNYTAKLSVASTPRLATAAFNAAGQPLGFQPATLVDPILFGGEPGFHFDPSTDGTRSFVDWPVSSRTNIGVLFRSEDGGQSFTKRYSDPADVATAGPACAGRQVPICLAGGGGDTNLIQTTDGKNLLYTSQVALANEAAGVSNDRGDTFPASQVDTAIGKTVTGVDRQWPGVYSGTHTVFTGFHVPLVGYYLERNDHDGAVGQWYNAASMGAPIDQPNIVGVAQSGSMVIDNTPGIHGIGAEPRKSRAIYVGYLSEGGLVPGSCAPAGGFAVGTSTDGGKTFSCANIPGASKARSFTVLALDKVGNLYAAWADSKTQKIYMSVAKADFKDNLTKPGSVFSAPVQVSDISQNVTIFPNIVAGDPGRVAIGYYGTAAKAATPDDVKKGAGGWNPFVATTANALCQQTGTPCATPAFASSLIATKPNQDDNICTSGTACAATGGNRNLLDYFDINLDKQGHLGFVWSDANNTTLEPYVKVTRQIRGPSLYADQPDASGVLRRNGAPDAAGDAIYPFYGTAARTSPNTPTLDLLGTSVGLADRNTIRVRMRLAKATGLGNLPAQTMDATTLLQQARYVTRFDTVEPNGHGRAFYVEVTQPRSTAKPTAGAGETSVAEGITYPGAPTSDFGNDYRPLSPATVAVEGNELVVDVPAASVGGLKLGSRLVSVGSYALLGPTDVSVPGQQAQNLFALPVTVDSTPTYDTVLGEQADTITAQNPTGAVAAPGKKAAANKKAAAKKKPAIRAARKVRQPTRTLAFTGLPATLAMGGALLLLGSAVTARRRRRLG